MLLSIQTGGIGVSGDAPYIGSDIWQKGSGISACAINPCLIGIQPSALPCNVYPAMYLTSDLGA